MIVFHNFVKVQYVINSGYIGSVYKIFTFSYSKRSQKNDAGMFLEGLQLTMLMTLLDLHLFAYV